MTPLPTSMPVVGAAIAAAIVGSVLGAAPATAQPAAPPIPRGMQQVVTDVIGPRDPSFWNPVVAGTRVLTPIESGVEVACATGFEPVISCSSLDMRSFTPQRSLGFIDVPVPVLGGPPLRMWFDYPRWGDGSTGDVNERFLKWWESRD